MNFEVYVKVEPGIAFNTSLIENPLQRMETTVALRQQFSQVLDEIRHDVVRMGMRVNELVKSAIDASLNGDLDLAQQVIRNDDEIDLYEEVIHKRAVLTVMQE